ncbi:phosphotransferase enzyme family protein [Aspergillus eucalypticola CBS 122712]|uniref:Phosphotransferase enzyme family protein n=1 Tax=Aspergillus eucalypticola (strain CBS 122712 / IBT 29274) TaxID=1448314 RepID=A0A317WAG2_ASPEC|nr:phosphotransferase enzyme family protein [Aspergillus eucalypticola CBS 122712]PWY81090.1 phosphotransferase enzyme family protein [Aspergillus eucalypticola CBS 122712]
MLGESASETVRLPTMSEIQAATERLSMSDAYDQVFRVGERFAVKSGYGVPLVEAETMKFLEEHQVPVPKVHASFKDPDSKKTISSWITSLATICNLIKNAISKLRSIPSPGYFGMVNRQRYLDGVFWTSKYDAKVSGPFTNQEDFNFAIIERLRQTESEQYIRLLGPMIDRTLSGHRPVFTNGDLQPKNIMVEKLGVRDGNPEYKITLLDWEGAGWYPEYWEFCNATIACRSKPDWLELVPDILDQYPMEFLMMQMVYASVFY